MWQADCTVNTDVSEENFISSFSAKNWINIDFKMTHFPVNVASRRAFKQPYYFVSSHQKGL
jgi:hypothetical protein